MLQYIVYDGVHVLVSFQLGKVAEAIQDCSKALELDEGYVDALQQRAKL